MRWLGWFYLEEMIPEHHPARLVNRIIFLIDLTV